MSKTKIEWCDYTINPVKGLCPMACPYCYARRMYKRFHWNETIREDITVYDQLGKMEPGSKVFIGSTMELFGDWVSPLMRSNIFHVVECYPELTFIFLTKQPQNLAKWSPFPDNCWVGVSATSRQQWVQAQSYLRDIKAPIKFYSFEPLLGDIVGQPETIFFRDALKNSGISWLIIGQQTPVRKSTMPRLEWVNEILDAANQAGIPVFLKDNLKSLLPEWAANRELRQEFPGGERCLKITQPRLQP